MMPKMQKLTFLDASTMACEGDLDLKVLARFGHLELHPLSAPEEVPGRLSGGTTIAFANKAIVGSDAMDAARDTLRLIVVCATGTNNIDLDAARERGLAVCNVSGYSAPSVAQHVFALLLNLATQCHRYAAETEAWAASPIFTRLDYPVIELAGKTLGIVGLGAIGRAVARIGEGFGMKVQTLRREGSPAAPGFPRLPAREFFETSDVITLHCPLTVENERMINVESLGWMKPTAFFINTGRGGLVDEAALLTALKNRSIAGAGLDVLTVEPPPADHPLIRARLPNLLITPHSAWTSREARQRMLDIIVENVRVFLDGGSLNRVV